MSSTSSPPKRPRRHSQNEFLSLMISAKRLPSSSYQQITDLNLSNLQLVQIDSFPFEYLPKLHSLDLSYNQLTTINIDWSKTTENFIEKFNVSHNKLETLLFLKDFKHLKTLNITENFLRNTERFLSLQLCPTIEHLIDSNQDQIEDEQLKLDQWLQIIDTKISRLWSVSYHDKYQQEITNGKPTNQMVKMLLDDFRHAMIRIFEKQAHFQQIHLSPLANYLIGKKIDELCTSNPTKIVESKKSLKTHLTADFNQLMEAKVSFEPVKFLRCHQTSESDLTNISVRMCAFEPNTTKNILATCGGQKVCFIDCDTCEVTHLYEVASLRSIATPIGRRMKDKTLPNSSEYFSCLCWIEIFEENECFKILAVGATNGHIYLLSYFHKLMFGQLELPASSIRCLTWHENDPMTLLIGSYNTVRLLNIQSYIERFQTFIRKQKKSSTQQFDYIESGVSFNPKLSSTHVYNFDHGDDSILHVTDLVYYKRSSEKSLILLVGTTAGFFYIENQIPQRLTFPKSLWTVGESIESIRLLPNQSHLIAMNILGLDQICLFDLEQSFANQQLHLVLSLSNPYRQIATKMAVYSINNENDQNGNSFECVIGSDHGTTFYHQIHLHTNSKKSKKLTFDTKRYDLNWPQAKNSPQPSLLSSSLNENYLCSTTTNNLICIYKRK